MAAGGPRCSKAARNQFAFDERLPFQRIALCEGKSMES